MTPKSLQDSESQDFVRNFLLLSIDFGAEKKDNTKMKEIP